jgi:hypothetical protein
VAIYFGVLLSAVLCCTLSPWCDARMSLQQCGRRDGHLSAGLIQSLLLCAVCFACLLWCAAGAYVSLQHCGLQYGLPSPGLILFRLLLQSAVGCLLCGAAQVALQQCGLP